ncbi:MAG: P-loop NTPase fold protein [Planctomycetota bacterium]
MDLAAGVSAVATWSDSAAAAAAAAAARIDPGYAAAAAASAAARAAHAAFYAARAAARIDGRVAAGRAAEAHATAAADAVGAADADYAWAVKRFLPGVEDPDLARKLLRRPLWAVDDEDPPAWVQDGDLPPGWADRVRGWRDAVRNLADEQEDRDTALRLRAMVDRHLALLGVELGDSGPARPLPESQRLTVDWDGWWEAYQANNNQLPTESFVAPLSEADPSTDVAEAPAGTVANGKEDRPALTDSLGRKPLAEALAALFASPDQGTPVTVGLFGEWGSGKSSLLSQIEIDLRQQARDHGAPGAFRFAWFNAWAYEQTDDLRAGLAQEVVKGLVEDSSTAFDFDAPERPRELEDLKRQGLDWPAKLALKWRFAKSAHAKEMWALAFSITGKAVFFAAVAALSLWSISDVLAGITFPAYIAASLTAFGVSLHSAWPQLRKMWAHPTTAELRTYLKLPDYGEHLGDVPIMQNHLNTLKREVFQHAIRRRGRFFRKQKPQQQAWRPRLFVFVDDLDRCSAKGIVETLDAIRLVMDMQDVIVAVAIDPRIALRAVAQRYKDVASAPKDEHAIGEPAEALAREYLEKILQLAVVLPAPEPESLSDFVAGSLYRGVTEADPATPAEAQAATKTSRDTDSKGAESPASPKSSGRSATDPPPDSDAAVSAAGDASSSPASQAQLEPGEPPVTRGQESPEPSPQAVASQVLLRARQEPVRDTPEERALFTQLQKAYGLSNPRQLIRLHNAHRLLKAWESHRGRAADGRFEPVDNVASELLMRLLFQLEHVAKPLLDQGDAAKASVLQRRLERANDRQKVLWLLEPWPEADFRVAVEHAPPPYDDWERFRTLQSLAWAVTIPTALTRYDRQVDAAESEAEYIESDTMP